MSSLTLAWAVLILAALLCAAGIAGLVLSALHPAGSHARHGDQETPAPPHPRFGPLASTAPQVAYLRTAGDGVITAGANGVTVRPRRPVNGRSLPDQPRRDLPARAVRPGRPPWDTAPMPAIRPEPSMWLQDRTYPCGDPGDGLEPLALVRRWAPQASAGPAAPPDLDTQIWGALCAWQATVPPAAEMIP